MLFFTWMEKLILPNSSFAEIAASLKEGKSVTLSVLGNSMSPFIRSGDVIVLSPFGGEPLLRWTAVFYCWKGHYMIHRIIGKESDCYKTMGDGNLWLQEEVGINEILGVLTKVYHSNGKCTDCLSLKWRYKGRGWHYIRFLHRLLCIIKNRFFYGCFLMLYHTLHKLLKRKI